MSYIQKAAIFLGLIILTACAPRAHVDEVSLSKGLVPIGYGKSMLLPSPAAFKRNVEAAQVLLMTYPGGNVSFEVRLSASRKEVSLVGMDMMGRRALTINWNGEVLNYSRESWVPATVNPGAVIADVFMLYADGAAINRQLEAVGCSLSDHANSRQIVCNGKELLSAEIGWQRGRPWNGITRYSNKAWNYQVEVQSSELSR